MLLRDLVAGIEGTRVRGDAGVAIAEVRDDSRAVGPGDLFVAAPGARVDGRGFVADAAARGAVAVVVEGDAPVDFAGAVVSVPNARAALASIAAKRFRPPHPVSLMALTGTNGKTTTTYLCEAILAAAGRRPGVIGTVSYRSGGKERPAPLTTPTALELHRIIAEMAAGGATDVVLEASSQGLDQSRLDGCRFEVAALTNVTQDHLDYHGTMDRYFAAKAILFERLMAADGVVVLFADRDDGRRMRPRARGRVITVSTDETAADVRVLRRALGADGIEASLETPAGACEVRSRLVGDYNLRNIALAVGMAVGRGLAVADIERGVASLAGVPGRLDRVVNDRDVLCVVDYAHTPDALERAMAALRPLARGRLVVLFGCGGDRDRSKRPLMGAAAARDADVVVITSDNPRTEDPQAIVAEIVEGARRQGGVELPAAGLADASAGFLVEVDRRCAIRTAVTAVRPGDALLIAGKGHEDYQILGTTKIHFDDREEAAAAFRRVD